MARKTLGSLFNTNQSNPGSSSGNPHIPSITEFCYEPQYLGFRDRKINLYPVQHLVLRAFYRGSAGNTSPECMQMTADEVKFCKRLSLDGPKNGNIIDKWNSGEIFSELVLVWGRRCLSEDTKITDPKTGRIWTFGEMWRCRHIDNIQSWTYNQDTHKMQVMPNCNLIHQGKRTVYKIKTKSGHEIEATDNHPFLTERGWVKVKDLQVGKDKVALATSEPFFGNSDAISEDEAALLGYITGDGNCSQRSVHFTCSDENVLKDFRKRLERVCPDVELFKDEWTGAKSKQYQYKIRFKDRDKFEYETYFNEKVGLNRVKRKTHSLKHLLIKHGLDGKTCHYKEVPKALYECPKNVIAAYLNALYSCDARCGSPSGNISSKSNCVEIEFYTVNHNQAIAVQTLLRRFGIFASLKKRVSKTSIKRENKSYICTSYRVSFSNRIYVKTFINCIGAIGRFSAIEKAKLVLDQPQQKIKLTENITFSNLLSIEPWGSKDTFDLQVSDEKSLQTFTAQGFIAHNSGKDFTISIIALYEAMRLIECPGGDPHKYYKLDAAPFNILTIANNKEQAQVLFQEIYGKLRFSPYFHGKYRPEGILAGKIHLLTPKDEENNKKLIQNGLSPQSGSVVIEAGHSNSSGLVGKGCFVLCLDEAGLYKRTGGPGSDEQIYGSLSPTVKTYIREEVIKDKNGNIKDVKTFYDGKIVSISSPRGMDGVFYNKYSMAEKVPHMLMCRLATWDVNPAQKEDRLRIEEPSMAPEKFRMEYGAEFSGTAGVNFFPPEFVEKCFVGHGQVIKDWGIPGVTYFAHLDPAVSSHNYALAVVHKQPFVNKEKRIIDFNIVLDHIRVWSPSDGRPIQIDDVDEYMIDLHRRFHFGIVTYDQWNCVISDCLINTYNGLKFAKDVKIGDKLYNRSGKLQSVVAREDIDCVECLTLRTKFGYEITVTKNHPFLVQNEFVEAQNLSIGDKLTIQDFTSFGVISNPKYASISGYIVSEGSVYKDSITFHNTEMEVIKDFISLCVDAGLNPKHYQPPMNHLSTVQGNTVSFCMSESRDLKGKIQIENGDCFTKSVPDFVMQGDRKTVAAFLSCIYEGDGNTCRNPNALLVEYNTSSKKLAHQLHVLLLQFGIKSSLKYYENKYFQGKQCPFYRISIYGENIDIFAKEIGFRSSRKNAELADILRLKNEIDVREFYNRKNRGIRKITKKKSSRSRQMWDRIVSIEPIKSTICHLEVSGDHTYISNGIVSHNSQSSIEKLRKCGVPAMCTRFSKNYKIQIYDELHKLVAEQRLKLPYHQLLHDEMIHLQRQFMNTGYRIYPKRDGEVRTDDTCVATNSIIVGRKSSFPISDVKVGDLVLCHDGKYHSVTGVSIHKNKRRCFRVKPFHCFALDVTDNHPILTDNGWKMAEKILPGDRVVSTFDNTENNVLIDLKSYLYESDFTNYSVKNFISENLIKMPNANSPWLNRFIKGNDFAFLCGVYVAEGFCGEHSVEFSTNHETEADFRKEISNAIKSTFGDIQIKQLNVANSNKIWVNSKIIKRLFKDMCSGKAISKELSPILMQSNKEFQKHFIRGFFEGDGCESGGNFVLTTTSRILCLQLQTILLRIGIVSSVSISKRAGRAGTIDGRNINYNDLYNIRIIDAESLCRFASIVSSDNHKKQSKFHKKHYEFISDNQIAFCVKSNNPIPCLDEVANISVDGCHSYVVNSITVHNCDALAAACFNAIKEDGNKLPQARLVNMPLVPSGDQVQYRSMQGYTYSRRDLETIDRIIRR